MANGLEGLKQEVGFQPSQVSRLERIGLMLSGFGAGVQGQLPQFQAGLSRRREELQKLDQQRLQALLVDNRAGLNFLKQGDIQGFSELLQNRVNTIEQLGGDPSDTLEVAELISQGRMDEAVAQMQRLDTLAVMNNLLPGEQKEEEFTLSPGQVRFRGGEVIARGEDQAARGRDVLSQVQSSQILPDGSTVQVFKDGSTRVTGPQGEVLTGPERAKSIIAAQEFGIDVQSRRAGGRAGATAEEKRASDLISRGIAAAESTATIRRGLELLDIVKTGGPQAISLAVKQRLGIEGANEGELSQSLGKSVLSQLRETFGAAFTENEGDRLARIEASFGKSVDTNRRLLNQALRIAERTANRAKKAALSRGSQAEAADIDDLLTFSLGIDEPGGAGGPPTITTQTEFDALPSGAIFIEDGQKFRKP